MHWSDIHQSLGKDELRVALHCWSSSVNSYQIDRVCLNWAGPTVALQPNCSHDQVRDGDKAAVVVANRVTKETLLLPPLVLRRPCPEPRCTLSTPEVTRAVARSDSRDPPR